MSEIVLSTDLWEALHATAPRSQARANAFAAKLPTGGKLVLSRLGVTLRTIAVGAWSVGAQRSDGRWPIVPGAFTDPGTGSGIPDWAEFRNASNEFVCGIPAGVGTGVLQLLTELVEGQPVEPGAFTITSLGIPPDNPTPPSGKRWFPGHYLFAAEDVDYTGMDADRRALVADDPNWVGYEMLYLWANHETSKGVYDFSLMLADLDKAEDDGKAVIIRPMERRFTSDRPFPVPQYIVDDYDGTWSSGSKVWIKTWVPEVAERYYLFIEALCAAVRDHPSFQGIFTEESSMGSNPDYTNLQPGYTTAGEANYWLELSERGSIAVGDGLFWMNMNYGYSSSASPTRAELMDTFVQTHKSAVGASDARMPGDPNGASTSYPFNPWRFAGTTALIAGVEYNTYAADSDPPRTAKQYLDFGVDTLGLTHMGWMARTDTSGVDFNIYDVIEEVAAQSGRINSARPTNFPAG